MCSERKRMEVKEEKDHSDICRDKGLKTWNTWVCEVQKLSSKINTNKTAHGHIIAKLL